MLLYVSFYAALCQIYTALCKNGLLPQTNRLPIAEIAFSVLEKVVSVCCCVPLLMLVRSCVDQCRRLMSGLTIPRNSGFGVPPRNSES